MDYSIGFSDLRSILGPLIISRTDYFGPIVWERPNLLMDYYNGNLGPLSGFEQLKILSKRQYTI